MVSFKRFLHIIVMIAALGGIFLIYSVSEGQPENIQTPDGSIPVREAIGAAPVDGGDKPRVWVLGDPEDGRCGEIYRNVLQLCRDLQLTVAGEGSLDAGQAEAGDLVIFCSDSVRRYADPDRLAEFIAGGGRAILAAGLGDSDPLLWQLLGILEMSPGQDLREMVFEKPLLPLQPQRACYGGSGSGSARLAVSGDVSVYIRDVETGVPILYTYSWQEGGACLINGNFLADARCMGLLTGAMAALLPDFVYPVLGVKAVFLDNFPMLTPDEDRMCRQLYGYSAEGFVRDMLWPALLGQSLRTDTPYTSSIPAVSGGDFAAAEDGVFTTICKTALQFGGELAFAASCPEGGEVVFDRDLIRRFSVVFPNYTVRGLAMTDGNFSREMLELPGADIRFVRGMLQSRDTRLCREDGYTVFPAATAGNSMEEGNLFSICSVLGAYGMVSHVFDVNRLITREGNTAAWDLDKRQIGLFESEVLARLPWLEGRTLSQAGGDVESYLGMEYGWAKDGSRLTLDCSGAVKGQAFFYHTGSRITGARGLTYQDVGNGYYLLRVRENHGVITLEEGR